MKEITGVIKDYAWGSTDAIAALLNRDATGMPQAEYWLGAHRGGPAVFGDGSTLDELITAEPQVLGNASRAKFGDRLPFLLKLLAAEQPLSLQAHPSRPQAEAGFRAQNEAGVPIDAPNRTYADDWPKPEMMVALTEFHALCGFRDPQATAQLFAGLGEIDGLDTVIGPLTQRSGSAGLAEVFLDVLGLDDARKHLVDQVVAAAVSHRDDPGALGRFARTAIEIDEHHPGDPGILAALLMNRVTLQPGEAIFLPAGNMHAYLHGTGVEIMASSDNVLRGGLTSKWIDVDALVAVVDFEAQPVEVLRPVVEADGLSRYQTPAPEFALWRVEVDNTPVMAPALDSARVLIVTAGHLVCSTADETIELVQGHSVFIAAGEQVQIDGDAQAFLAASGV